MFIAPLYDTIVEEEIDELLNTFRTQFWLDEHHWYVRCDWNPIAGSRTFGYLYTLPYAFRLFTGIAKGLRRSKWTCPDDEKYCLFNRVHNLDCMESVNEQLNIHHAYFPNIHYLQISLPLPDNIWKIIPTFDHLTSLRISIHEKDSESDLQVLFDRAPRLYKLIVDNADKSELTGLPKLKSASVRHLQFDSSLYSSPYYFDDEECTKFAMSSLGQQCEVLQLFVESREKMLPSGAFVLVVIATVILDCNGAPTNCTITLQQYTTIQIGWTQQQVTQFLGSPGIIVLEVGTSGSPYQIISVQYSGQQSSTATASFLFMGGSLYTKSQAGMDTGVYTITSQQYQAIQPGWTRDQVTSLCGSPGSAISESGTGNTASVSVMYTVSGTPYAFASFTFTSGQITSMFEVGLDPPVSKMKNSRQFLCFHSMISSKDDLNQFIS
ncbi:unnamed protein product [Adineta steineri]|uniref:Uncharacterized protein n=1 Tax=Adineta steineri TaxID=433720 RepID=A0A819LZ68_9BILA|nr:unnamed protein product [Adineta steineri]CAF3969849.1 unnamed protein product [Adineta steineri]